MRGRSFTILAIAFVLSGVSSSASWAQNRLADEVVGDIMRCTASLDIDIDATRFAPSLADLILEGAGEGGRVKIDGQDFLSLFDGDDNRLNAYKIYTNCLLQRYESSDNGETFIVKTTSIRKNELQLSYGREEILRGAMDSAVETSRTYTFSTDRWCTFFVDETPKSQLQIKFALRSERGSLIDDGYTGRGYIQAEISPGNYRLIVAPSRGGTAGVFRMKVSLMQCE